MWSANRGGMETFIKELIDAGVNVNAKDNSGTPSASRRGMLPILCAWGSLRFFNILPWLRSSVSFLVLPRVQGMFAACGHGFTGFTALKGAVVGGRQEYVNLLLDHGMSWPSPNGAAGDRSLECVPSCPCALVSMSGGPSDIWFCCFSVEQFRLGAFAE